MTEIWILRQRPQGVIIIELRKADSTATQLGRGKDKIMSWDYRVIEHNGMFTVHEVHYNNKGDITSISQDPMGPSGDTLEELKGDMEYFLQALDMPVLKKDETVFAPEHEEETEM